MSKTVFRSTDGTPKHIALTSGHSTVIPPEGKAIHSRFHRKAVEAGCLPTNVDVYTAPDAETGDFDREKIIDEAIRTMLDSSDPAAFTEQGQPSINMLSKTAGFRVDRQEVAPIWKKIEAELAGEGDTDSGE